MQKKQFNIERNRINRGNEKGIRPLWMGCKSCVYKKIDSNSSCKQSLLWGKGPSHLSSLKTKIESLLVCIFPISSEVLKKKMYFTICCNNFPIYPKWRRKESYFWLIWNLCISKTVLIFLSFNFFSSFLIPSLHLTSTPTFW